MPYMALIFCLPCMYRPCTTCVFLLELYAGSIRRCALAILLEIARRCTFTILLEAHARGRAPGCKISISHVGSCPGPLGVCLPSCLGFMLKVVLRCLLAVFSRMHGQGCLWAQADRLVKNATHCGCAQCCPHGPNTSPLIPAWPGCIASTYPTCPVELSI